ncbi:hypothetical protein V2J09_010846 [Rumex salicifolius]
MEQRKVLLERYEMGRVLGVGNFGKVCVGRHVETGECVAIKIISKKKAREESLTEQIKREISAMKMLKHPNIVEIKEVMASKTKIYIVMEYVKGGELLAKVDKEKLGEEVARKYFRQLIEVVEFCHEKGVCHRDLKLENLMLDDSGDNIKVIDFGLSALTHRNHLLYTLCGAPAYVAPQVLKREGYDGFKADIWSCGVILFTLLSGHLPFQATQASTGI